MVRYVFAVRDKAAEVFNSPFTVPAVGLAQRGFTDEVNRQDSQNAMNNHPEDFSLYLLGEFDDETGEFVNQKRLIVEASDVFNC